MGAYALKQLLLPRILAAYERWTASVAAKKKQPSVEEAAATDKFANAIEVWPTHRVTTNVAYDANNRTVNLVLSCSLGDTNLRTIFDLLDYSALIFPVCPLH